MGLDFLQLKPVEVAVVEQGSTSPKNVKVMEDASEEEQKPVENLTLLTDAELSKFTRDFCLDCHHAESPEAGVDLSWIGANSQQHHGPQLLQKVRDAIRNHEMPPGEVEQPTLAERRAAADDGRNGAAWEGGCGR